ncbi:hypothetical protein LCGC14_1854960 [marine sediment metagenome]|uniref:Uncharacterized protein n=1 Tax=marine sediment metagenome TaxID=412755 RepID=A0A0F9GXK2_9ZZZZ
MTNFKRIVLICALWLCVALLAVVFFGDAAGHEQENDPWREAWVLFTQTEGGNISMTRGLTEYECEFARNRALGLPATDEERQNFKAAINAINERRETWAEENNCRAGGGSTSAESHVTDDGRCVFGFDLAYLGTGMFIISEWDIKRAECFISPDQ